MVAQLHAATPAPVVAPVFATRAIAAHGTEPRADARAHLSRQLVNLLEAVGEVGVERPRAVSVPAIVEDIGHGSLAIHVVELCLPVAHHVLALRRRHVARVVAIEVLLVVGVVYATVSGGVVAVYVKLVP